MKANGTSLHRAGSSGCLIIFALPFALVGAAMIWLICSTVFKTIDAAWWPATPAQVEELELHFSGGKKNGTKRVNAKYTYQHEGKTYSSDRVSLSVGSDNIGSFHEDLYNSLNQKRLQKEEILCFVNPNRPEEALLNRDLRLSMLILYLVVAITFGGVGFAILGGSLISWRKAKRTAAMLARYPGQPWKCRDDWAQGHIRSNSGHTVLFVGGFSIFVCALTLPILYALIAEVAEKRNYAALLALIFPAFGFGLGYWAIRSFAIWKRFGRALLRPSKMPIRPGHEVRAELALEETIVPLDGEFPATVTCTKLKRTRMHGKTSYQTISIYDESCSGKAHMGARGTTITYTFIMPSSLPDLASDTDGERVTWLLKVRGKLPGTDLALDFELPVYRE